MVEIYASKLLLYLLHLWLFLSILLLYLRWLRVQLGLLFVLLNRRLLLSTLLCKHSLLLLLFQ